MLLSKNRVQIVAFVFLHLVPFLGKTNEAFAQREVYLEDNPPLKDRMYYGGNFSLQFGSVTVIDISTLSGVMLTEKLSTGLGATYQFLNFRHASSLSCVYAGMLFGRYNSTQNFFAHTEA